MKRYIHRLITYLPALLLALAGTGCADDIEPDTPAAAAPDSITLTLSVPCETVTRAPQLSISDLHEFEVKSVHLYFYKSGDTESSYDCIVDGAFTNTKTVTVPMPANALDTDGLFGSDQNGATCKVYAVANVDDKLPQGTSLPEGTPKSINQLKALQISSTFDQTKAQPSFAMDGGAVITLDDGAARRASGTIELTRAAAKLTLTVDLPTEIEVTDETDNTKTVKYKPNVESMRVWIGNGVQQSKLNTAAEKPKPEDAENIYYSNKLQSDEGEGSAFTYDGSAEKYKYFQDVPFYSYPNKWEANSADGSTHMTLVIPWTQVDDQGNMIGNQKVTYYRLPVQPEECKIERNMHYDLRVSISRLGSVDPQEPVDMTVDWNYAIPWNQVDLETDIKAIRYLILNNNYYDSNLQSYVFEMNNETSTEITLGTSHDVEIAEVTLSCIDYSQSTPTERSIQLATTGNYRYSNIAGYEANSIYAGIEVVRKEDQTDPTTKKIITSLQFKRDFKHITWNNNSPSINPDESAFCAYTFDIKLRHTDDDSKTANVRIIQYPAIYITADLTPSDLTDNWGYIIETTRFVNNNNTSNSNYKGFVGQSGSSNGLHLGSIHEGNNRNTYVITISRFDENEKDTYIIADPRSRNFDNLLYQENGKSFDWSVKDEKGKSLQYYYPTDKSKTKTRYIAPQFRIASQMGITYKVYYDAALRRCASYQENGRPAGRWRLPTIAEIEFIAKLSNKRHIPFLFGDDDEDANYWCASGAVEVINTADIPVVNIIEDAGDDKRYARCVYDEWYWNDVLKDPTKFTWGDRQRGDNNIDMNVFQLEE